MEKEKTAVLKESSILFWKDSGKKISWMVMGGVLERPGIIMLANLWMEKEAVKENMFGAMEIGTKVSGLKIYLMDLGLFI